MPQARQPKTIAQLRTANYKVLPVREEMRKNLIARISKGEKLFPGIVGYEDTVIPQLENALFAGQDVILLGERGQAKSRVIRQMTGLLDEEAPTIAGCEINDNPFKPICAACRVKVAKDGDDVELEWIGRERRYAEKLATPDVSMADVIGEVDPIKVAEGRYLGDELTIHYGLIPRVNRGIFCINELPDLAERIQVGLFNLLEERDVQIRGYLIRLPVDVYVVATANPEDYTNRGRIITPLKDRYGAQIRTHYPKTIDQEIEIAEQERSRFEDAEKLVTVPQFMKEIVAEFTFLARKSPEINQRSGVSLRVTIANLETLVAASMRRVVRYKEKTAAPRVSDLPFMLASSSGKLELETVEEGRETRVIDEITKKAVLNTFGKYFTVRDFDPLIQKFEEGLVIETGTDVPSFVYAEKLGKVEALAPMIEKLQVSPKQEGLYASAVEFVLDGLHLNRRLNRDKVEGKFRYRG
ncbi:MAG: magnesium chelatase [Dehalococcoidia bacterium]|nr:magnesium chelatase [Dehalococcoidia bacterium]